VSNGGWTVVHNRGTEWQVGCTIAKGSYPRVRAEGLEAVRRPIAQRVPWLADRTDALRDWNQVSLLAVESSRLRRWYRPGLLLIGDAAHTMSPVGAVGITVAMQDAAVASNVLGPRLRAGDGLTIRSGRRIKEQLVSKSRKMEAIVGEVKARFSMSVGSFVAEAGDNTDEVFKESHNERA